MATLDIAFVGFGNVGQGLANLLLKNSDYLKDKFNLSYRITAITDAKWGAIGNSKGINLKEVLEVVRKEQGLPRAEEKEALNVIKESNADVIVEATFTDIETAEPALTYIKAALDSGKHVISTNKGPPALAMRELEGLAEKKGVFYRYEGTVMSGTPCLNLATEAMAGVKISSIRGILNGTCNYILEKMETGEDYQKALGKAQKLGYAEADPKADVEGWDAVTKTIILSNKLLGADLKIPDVKRVGITKVSPRDIKKAREGQERVKLIANAERKNDNVSAEVSPQAVSLGDPLGGVNGVLNAVTFSTDSLGEVTIVGPGAGGKPTGQALLQDLLAINKILEAK